MRHLNAREDLAARLNMALVDFTDLVTSGVEHAKSSSKVLVLEHGGRPHGSQMHQNVLALPPEFCHQ
jgi:hypothetical protein